MGRLQAATGTADSLPQLVPPLVLFTLQKVGMTDYHSLSNDFYININLNTEMELSTGRETVLHFFELMQKKYPGMSNFGARERGELLLEEDKDGGSYRWASVEPRRVCSGFVNPPSIDSAAEQHEFVLERLPFALGASPIDCESLSFMFGFDFNYRGNHNQLLAEALGMIPAFEKFLEIPGASLLAYDPAIQFALDSDCRVQCRVSLESRTSAYSVRTSEFPEDQISVYVTARRYGSLERTESFVSTCQTLRDIAVRLVDQYVIDNVLHPLQQAIAIS